MQNDCILIKTSEFNKLKEPKQKFESDLEQKNKDLKEQVEDLNIIIRTLKEEYENNPKIDPMKLDLSLYYETQRPNSYYTEFKPITRVLTGSINLEESLRKQILAIAALVSRNFINSWRSEINNAKKNSHEEGKNYEKESIKGMGYWERRKYLK